jgi:hypothetical protein
MRKVAGIAVRACLPLAACMFLLGLAGLSRAADKPQLKGVWNFDPDQSDDAQQKVHDAQEKAAGARRESGGGYPSGGTYPNDGTYPGGDYPAGGVGVGIGRVGIGGPMGGGIGRHGGMGRQGARLSSEVWDELAANPKFLRIDQREQQVVITDDAGHARTFYPDGKKHQETDTAGKKTSTKAAWDGDTLIAESKLDHSGKLTETYRLSTDGKQLYVVSRFEASSLTGPLSIRRVYDLAKAAAQ